MTIARRFGALLACGLVVAFLVWGVAGGWEKAASYPWHPRPGELTLGILALGAFNVCWAVGYTGVLELVAGRRAPRRRTMSIWARSLLGRYVPGNVMMFAGRIVLGRQAGIPAQATVAASVYEQVTMLVAASVAAAGFVLGSHRARALPLHLLVLAVPLVVVILDPAILRAAAGFLSRRLGRSVELPPLERRRVLAVLGWFALTMALLGCGVGFGLRGLAGTQIGSVSFVGLAFLLAWVLSMLAFIFPSGLGIREGAFAVMLAGHVPAAASVSLAAGSRLLVTGVELLVVAAFAAAGHERLTPSRG
ncbi:MAG: hypothetical protein ACXVUE_25085 [Solirubrobacteraceae bacterium]